MTWTHAAVAAREPFRRKVKNESPETTVKMLAMIYEYEAPSGKPKRYARSGALV